MFRRTTLERFVFEHELGSQGFETIEEAIADSPELIQVADGKLTTQTAYAPGDVLVPIQDYRKQRLIRGEQYRVIAVNSEAQQVVLETPNGSVLSVNPAACPRKTVYTTQLIPVAVGDRL